MQRLQMNPRWEWGLISLIKSYLAFSFFYFSKTTLLQLGLYYCGIMMIMTKMTTTTTKMMMMMVMMMMMIVIIVSR